MKRSKETIIAVCAAMALSLMSNIAIATTTTSTKDYSTTTKVGYEFENQFVIQSASQGSGVATVTTNSATPDSKTIETKGTGEVTDARGDSDVTLPYAVSTDLTVTSNGDGTTDIDGTTSEDIPGVGEAHLVQQVDITASTNNNGTEQISGTVTPNHNVNDAVKFDSPYSISNPSTGVTDASGTMISAPSAGQGDTLTVTVKETS